MRSTHTFQTSDSTNVYVTCVRIYTKQPALEHISLYSPQRDGTYRNRTLRKDKLHLK